MSFRVHLAEIGTVYERVVDEKGQTTIKWLTTIKHPTKVLCGQSIADHEFERSRTIMVWEHESSCRDCLQRVSSRRTEHVQPVRLPYAEAERAA